MKQQTAVQFLIEKLKEQGINLGNGTKMIYPISKDIIEMALQMEKDNHYAWNKFLEDEKTLGISDTKTIERVQWYYNTYFSETY
jgi:hypothetical protein